MPPPPSTSKPKPTVPSLADFLSSNSLQKVDPQTLDPEDHCMICHTEYDSATESPVRLPCGHVFGESCILQWLWARDRNTCPLCSRVLFRHDERDAENTVRLVLPKWRELPSWREILENTRAANAGFARMLAVCLTVMLASEVMTLVSDSPVRIPNAFFPLLYVSFCSLRCYPSGFLI